MTSATQASAFTFDVIAEDGATGARAGILHTPHGAVETPTFMPVGTQATVKTLTQTELMELQASVILANAYHLYLRPGHELIEEMGGLHDFMNWPRPILTDSGGFQVFSLAELARISEQGVHFQSHLDGSHHLFTPERVMEIEHALGADIIMAFDECTPYPTTEDYARSSMERTLRWAERCLSRHRELATDRAQRGRPPQALFGIVQGSVYPALRRQSARDLTSLDLPGYAVGGLGVGEPRSDMLAMLEESLAELPGSRPRYLMGVGLPEDLVDCVQRGVDMFDCVIPTRNARNATLFTSRGRVRMKNAAHARDVEPVDPDCQCSTCQHHHRAYLRHLFQSNEILGLRLATLHNVHFYLELMRRMRQAIIDGEFSTWRSEFLARYVEGT
ncbi:MAG: tRNA guanosine(34) transglycosylase Tgt [Candidatus Latescibacterota bacterium]|nr:tRNA guanosine(34) transglycosylase Tgt [Candidatus Latescibacterota bacterium]